jgi:flagellar motor switch/type III secretory pathway protein FliN
MALDTVEPAAPRLPRLDPEAADGMNTVLAALDGQVLDGLTVSVAPQTQADIDAAVDQVAFMTPHGPVQVAPTLADGAVFVSQDHVALLSVVSALEPLFAALEDAGAEALRPEGVTRADLADAVRVTVGLADAEGRALHAARLSLAPAVAQRLRRSGEPAPVLDIPLPVNVVVQGPDLLPDQLTGLRSGDLVLIPTEAGGWRVRLAAGGAAGTALGLFYPATRLFTHQTKDIRMTDEASSESVTPRAAPETNLAPASDTPVAVTIDLGETAVPLKTLTGLTPGAVLPLAHLAADLPVTLSSAGRAFARGRLVSLGDAHAVLIDAVGDATERR